MAPSCERTAASFRPRRVGSPPTTPQSWSTIAGNRVTKRKSPEKQLFGEFTVRAPRKGKKARGRRGIEPAAQPTTTAAVNNNVNNMLRTPSPSPSRAGRTTTTRVNNVVSGGSSSPGGASSSSGGDPMDVDVDSDDAAQQPKGKRKAKASSSWPDYEDHPDAQAAAEGLEAQRRLDALDRLLPGAKLLARDPAEAEWFVKRIWDSAMSWMDVRLRFMRGHHRLTVAQKGQGALVEPPSLDLRQRLINTRVHGGNLRTDVALAKLHYGAHRHADGTYDTFSEQLFSRIYGLTVAHGLWLAKASDTDEGYSHGIDWRYIVEFIDAYLWVRDLTLGDAVGTWVLPDNFAAVEASFAAYLAGVKAVVVAASCSRAGAGWRATLHDTNELRTHAVAVEAGLMATPAGRPRWTGRGSPGPAWDAFSRLQNDAWAPTLMIQGRLNNRRVQPPPAQTKTTAVHATAAVSRPVRSSPAVKRTVMGWSS